LIKDARDKAKLIIRKAPPMKRNFQGHHAASDLYHFQRRDYWTYDRKRDHRQCAAARRLPTSRLAVNQAMLDAVDMDTGYCAATAKKLATASGFSVAAVKSARRELLDEGLWIAERGVYIPVPFDTVPAPANDDAVMRVAA
jgi:hypothetical protein